MKKILPFDLVLTVIIVALSALFFYFIGGSIEYPTDYSITDQYRAKVDSVAVPVVTGEGDTKFTTLDFVATITGGELNGTVVGATQYYDEFIPGTLRLVEVGDRIILQKTLETDALAGAWVMANFDRTYLLIGTLAVFLLVVVLIGRKKGFLAILTLALTLAAIFIVLVPSILAGYNIYLVTGGVVVYIIVMSLLILNGANSKTYCAIIGNMSGLALSGVLGYLANQLFMITGFTDQDTIYLTYTKAGAELDIAALVWCGVVVGSLGAVMDVSMSLSSSMRELADNMHDKNRLGLIRSGLNIGHDIIGTMMNTLVLAYIGSSLVSVMLIYIYQDSIDKVINHEVVLVEILQSMIGSAGILLAVPLTVLVAAYVYLQGGNNTSSITKYKALKD